MFYPNSQNVLGIDVNKELVETLGNDNIKVMSATDLQFHSNQFDKVLAFEVVEHIDNIKAVFLEAFRVLSTTGKLIISFPFEIIRGQSALVEACVIRKDPLYARKLHIHKLTPRKIKKIIKGIPFKKIKSQIVFIPFPSFVMIFEK